MVDVATFGEWLLERRRGLGIRHRKDFADRAGIADTLVWEIETGKGKPFHERRDVIRRAVARTLGVPLDALDAFSRGERAAPTDDDTPLVLSVELSRKIREFSSRENRDPLDWLAAAVTRAEPPKPGETPAFHPAVRTVGKGSGRVSDATIRSGQERPAKR